MSHDPIDLGTAAVNEVRELAGMGLITALGGLPHTTPDGDPCASGNIVINCPALAFLEEAPTGPRLPLLP